MAAARTGRICRGIELDPVYHVIEAQFRRILAHKIRVAEQTLAGLVKSGQMPRHAGRTRDAGADRPR